MIYIYVLQLKNNKYYVGKTKNPNFRIDQHFNNNGSAWTTKYHPIKIFKIYKNCDDYDEDKYTKKYMSKFGINNVRGGSYTKIKLDNKMIDSIELEINSANDKCFICNKKDHFASSCPEKQSAESNYDTNEESDEESDEESYEESDEDYYEIWSCQYCGKEFETLKGATFHENIHCKHKGNTIIDKSYESDNYVYDNYKKKANSYKSNKHNCYRCGRNGHFADSCYAIKHIKGYYIEN